MRTVTPTDLSPAESSRRVTVGVVLVVGVAGILLGPFLAGLNAVVVALVVGIAVANLASRWFDPADQVTSFLIKRVLKAAVILLGAGIDLAIVADIGGPALATTALAVVVALVVAAGLGIRLGLAPRPATLIGVGTAICGASAIAAVAPVLRAKREEIGVALATIFTFNAAALILYPIIGGLVGMSDVAFGTWAGIGVHDTAASVATGFTHSDTAGEVATLVKLTRTLFLIPLILVVSAWEARGPNRTESGLQAIARSFPWFVVGFVVLALANTLGWLGGIGDVANDVAKLAIVFVVAAVGLTLRFSRVAAIGRPLFVTGFAASLAVGGLALAALGIFGIG